jgi:hypothetical protein
MNSFAYNTNGDALLRAAESILQDSLQEADIKRVKYDVVIAKLKDGIWDTSYDVKPRTHLEVIDNKTKKSITIFVEDTLQEADDFYAEKMIKNQLETIVRNSSECIDMIERGLKFPEWAQSKIAVAEDGIVSVTEFIQSHYSNKA